MEDGCKGAKGPTLIEKKCPNCGETVELASTDAFVKCDNCGEIVFGDLMGCVFNCPRAKECVGEEQYNMLMANKDAWIKKMEEQSNEDEW